MTREEELVAATSTQGLRERLDKAGKKLRETADCADGVRGAVPRYGEAVTAVLLDAMDHYVEAAARDREAGDRQRASQHRQGTIMLIFTAVIALSTIAYTVAAWRQPQQPTMIASPRTQAVSSFPEK